MRPDGSRKKKLTVAFHFQFANQAGWKCEECRRNGLAARRRCGWMPAGLHSPERVVWARKGAATTTCPRSYITAESLGWVEEFLVGRRLGRTELREMPARDAEAHLILAREWEAEYGDDV